MLARHTGISFTLYATSSEDLPQLRLLVQNVYVCTDKCACVCVCILETGCLKGLFGKKMSGYFSQKLVLLCKYFIGTLAVA